MRFLIDDIDSAPGIGSAVVRIGKFHLFGVRALESGDPEVVVLGKSRPSDCSQGREYF
jgi:hypothetical protein